jgi:uncharacterized membrane-anchored protein
MKRLSILVFILVALAQLSVPAVMVWDRQLTFKHGRVWKFKTAPVDPEDVIRGRYIALSFANEEFPQEKRYEGGSPVYVALKEDAEGFAAVDHLSAEALRGDNVVRAEPGGWWDGKQHVLFPFRKYWVAETIAPEAETAYRNNSTRKNQNAFVTVRVRDGDAALEQLYIDNKPLVEYLRELKHE